MMMGLEVMCSGFCVCVLSLCLYVLVSKLRTLIFLAAPHRGKTLELVVSVCLSVCGSVILRSFN